MGIYRILGVLRREPVEASYLDVKYLNDTAARWRQRIRAMVQDHRQLKKSFALSRYKAERYALAMEYKLSCKHLKQAWQMYRSVQADAMIMQQAYREQASRNREKNGRRRSA